MRYVSLVLLLVLASTAPGRADNAECQSRTPYSRVMAVQVYPTFTYTLEDSYGYEWTQDTLVQDLMDQFPGHFARANGAVNLTINVTISNTNGHPPFTAGADVTTDDGGRTYVVASLPQSQPADPGTFQDPPAMLSALATKIGQRVTLGWTCTN